MSEPHTITEADDVENPQGERAPRASSCSAVPETQETFDSEFSTRELDANGIAGQIDSHMTTLRKDAGDFVRALFLKHGYFNGRAEGTVRHDEESETITCEMVVTCWGLPEVASGENGKLREVVRIGKELAGHVTRPIALAMPFDRDVLRYWAQKFHDAERDVK